AEPNVELAERAGLTVDQGVAVDQRCQSSRAGIFAAGDVASWWSPRWERRLRVEHYDNAHQQGLYVAGSMLGEQDEYDPIPYFWTEQYQAMVQQVGVIDNATRPVLRGDPASGRFSVFHLRGDRLSGCTTVNRFPDLAAARRVITAGAPIPPGLLEDQGSDLREWSQNLERG
ncbi:MAG TPA: oxidoreductase C-terminal domain-containing protein, partial [Candidatus Dormibacteraeota bacterium]